MVRLSSSSSLVAIILASSVVAKPIVIRDSPVTLSLTRKFKLDGTRTVLQRDQARAAALSTGLTSKTTSRRDAISVNATNVGELYSISVGVGSPATQYTLIIDTGSSNTWVGAGQSYTPTSTSSDTGNAVSVSYGSGSFSGEEFIDQVDLGNGLVISQQSIGVASSAEGFNGFDGILGLGPDALTQGTLSGNATSTIPTVTDNLFAAGTISSNLVGISFNPTTSDSDVNGELSFGDTDSSQYIGDITFVPITSTAPSSSFWGLDLSIDYGSTSLLSSTSGILDTGTTLILIATEAFNQYQSATGGTLDQSTGLLTISNDQFTNLQDLNFNVAGTTFTLSPNAQIWPRSLNAEIGGNPDQIYLVVADIGSLFGSGLDFINGYTFLERFYSVFDTGNQQVGLAVAPNTNATSN